MSDDQPARFADLGLAPEILAAVEALGYETPSAIQAGAIPALLEGRDLIGQAQTGTGKTAAFALPMLQRLDMQRRDVQALVLTPTRELAMQVAEAVRAYGRKVGKHGVRVLPVYGGQAIHIQRKALEGTVHVVIGTPGRVRDHLSRGTLDLSGVHFFCLDEADEMLNMGFLEDVEWILEHAPESRQIALFSATMPGPIRRVAKRFLVEPADVRIARETRTVAKIDQLSLRVARHAKKEALERILGVEEHEAVLIFAGTQRMVEEVAEYLQSRGIAAEGIHGGMSQQQRDAVVRRLRGRRIQVVVGTDVAARGLDVDHIGLVINYDLPRDPEVYVHRVGRTGRAGREGRSISLWSPREQRMLRTIERFSGQPMTPMAIPGVEDLLARRRARTVEQLQAIAQDDLGAFLAWADEIGEQLELDATTLAAAALRLAWGDEPLRAKKRDEPAELLDTIEIVLPIGFRDNLKPGAVVGAIAGETGLPGGVVGRINMLERVTFVEVAAQHVETILEKLEGAQIAGRRITPRLAHPEGGTPPRGPRRPGGARGPSRGPRGKGGYGGKGGPGRKGGYGGKGGPRRRDPS